MSEPGKKLGTVTYPDGVVLVLHCGHDHPDRGSRGRRIGALPIVRPRTDWERRETGDCPPIAPPIAPVVVQIPARTDAPRQDSPPGPQRHRRARLPDEAGAGNPQDGW